MASYTKDVKTALLLSIVGFGMGIGIQSSLAWFLLPKGRGEYAVCIVVFATLLTLACALGQEMANVYYVGAKKLTLSQAMTQSLFMGVLVSIIACIIGYLLTLTSLPFLNKAPVELFRLSLLCIPAMIFYLYLSRIFLGMREILTFKCLLVGVHVLALAGLLAAGALGMLNVKTAILIQAISNAIMAFITLLLLRFRYGCRIVSLELASLLRSLGYGVRCHFGKLAMLVNVQMATIVLSCSAVGPEQLGLFSVAVALTSQILMIPGAIQVAIIPRAAADSTGQSRMVAQSIRLCLACCLFLALMLFVLSKPIIIVVLSPRFLPILVPLWVLLPGVLFRTVSRILPAYFAGIDRPQITSAVIAVSITANLVLIRLLLPIWGLTGVAFANTTACLLEAVVMGLFFQHYSGFSFWSLVRFNREDWNTIVQLWQRSWRQLRRGNLGTGEL